MQEKSQIKIHAELDNFTREIFDQVAESDTKRIFGSLTDQKSKKYYF